MRAIILMVSISIILVVANSVMGLNAPNYFLWLVSMIIAYLVDIRITLDDLKEIINERQIHSRK